jgi:hypothetical protein
MKKKVVFILVILFYNTAFSQTSNIQSADYIIEISASVITAHPRPGTSLKQYSGTDAFTIIQDAITALTLPGAGGSGGGKIEIASGTYNLTNELTITGWEGNTNPTSQIIIQGDGWATKIVQQTAGKNAFVVKNAANFKLSDLFIYTGANAKSCLLADDSGTSEISCFKSILDNVLFQSKSTASPAVYLKNFFDLSAPSIHAENTSNYAIILENTSKTINYGNSNFGFVRAISSTTAPYAGLYIKSSNSNGSHFLNLMTFSNYECVIGYRGIYSSCSYFNTFKFVDIEGIPQPIYFDGSTTLGETRDNKFLSGYLFPSTGGIAITNTLYSGGNDFNLFIEGESTGKPILDQQAYRPVNSYNLTLGGININNISITTPTTPLMVKKADGTVINNVPVISLTTVKTSVNGSVSGSAEFSQPFTGPDYKRVLINVKALTGTASYTYPVAFTQKPAIVTTNGPAASVVTSLSTTAITITGVGATTGFVILEGY